MVRRIGWAAAVSGPVFRGNAPAAQESEPVCSSPIKRRSAMPSFRLGGEAGGAAVRRQSERASPRRQRRVCKLMPGLYRDYDSGLVAGPGRHFGGQRSPVARPL